MKIMQETLFDLLLNASWQIAVFAVVAAVLSRLAARARARFQNLFYLAAFLFCMMIPAINTFVPSHAAGTSAASMPPIPEANRGQDDHFWSWHFESGRHRHVAIPRAVQGEILSLWGVLILFRLLRLSRAARRVHRLRNDASVSSPEEIGMASQIIEANYQVALLASPAIDEPVTVGLFHPAILLPTKVLPVLAEQELAAIVAHEFAHIRRKDFLVHILCELISTPFAWHPGIRYLMSKISQTREAACDDYAAARIGKRRSYAGMLLHVASLCVHTTRPAPAGLGIFDGDNLETRIMMLTEKRRSLSRAGVVCLALATTFAFGTSALLAHAMSLQTNSSSGTAAQFAGTWHWMFDGRSFATMILVQNGPVITGSVTGSHIALNDDGGLNQADPSGDRTPSPITQATLKDSVLHITVKDGFEFSVTLKDETHAEIQPGGAPPNMKPISAEREGKP